jgi:valyl-tRNA synthetase
MVKPRAYGQGFSKEEQEAAWFTLHECMKKILLLLAPIIPFITEKIWREVYSKESIHKQEFPKAERKVELEKLTEKIIEFNSKIWNLKKEKGISLKDEIEIEIPEELKPFEKDLKAMHNIKL